MILLPLFNVMTPKNTATTFKVLLQVASFDIFPVDAIFQLFGIDTENGETLNFSFENAGF